MITTLLAAGPAASAASAASAADKAPAGRRATGVAHPGAAPLDNFDWDM